MRRLIIKRGAVQRVKWDFCSVMFYKISRDQAICTNIENILRTEAWRPEAWGLRSRDKEWQWRRGRVREIKRSSCRQSDTIDGKRRCRPLPRPAVAVKVFWPLETRVCQRQLPESCWASGLVGYGRDQDLNCPESPLPGFPTHGDSKRSLALVVIIHLYGKRLISVSFRPCHPQEYGRSIADSIQLNPHFNKMSLRQNPQYFRDFCRHQSSARHRRMSLLYARFLLSRSQKESHYSLPSDCCWCLLQCRWVYLLPLANWSTSFLHPILWGHFLTYTTVSLISCIANTTWSFYLACLRPPSILLHSGGSCECWSCNADEIIRSASRCFLNVCDQGWLNHFRTEDSSSPTRTNIFRFSPTGNRVYWTGRGRCTESAERWHKHRRRKVITILVLGMVLYNSLQTASPKTSQMVFEPL